MPISPVQLFLTTAIACSFFGNSLSDELTCFEYERTSLLMFKNDHLGHPSYRLSSWTGTNCCEWDGVSCDNVTGHVHGIHLRDLDLDLTDLGFQGDIPNSRLGNLSTLGVLDLSGNSFNSPVPHWITSLNSLVHLDLSHCGLHGPLPTALQNMKRLEYLNLSSNNFNSTLPAWLFDISIHLKVLSVAGNLIQGELPPNIGNSTSLVSLDLSQNQLGGPLPKSMCNLCGLEEIYLSTNKFWGPVEVFFTGCVLKSLRFLYLSSNRFSGELPDNLGGLSRLRELDLAGNNMTGSLPTSLGQLQELEYLATSLNPLEGVVSEAHFTNLSRLKTFRANGNKFSFGPKANWVPPFQLRGLSLRTWRLGPKFPIWIKQMRDLDHLSLVETGIVDTIPGWFWNLTSKLGHLNLSCNRIQGQIPSFLNFGLYRTVSIDLRFNLISGLLPPISSNISILDMSFNQISGSLHHSLCNNARQTNRLQILNLRYNNMSGEIPDCWTNWPLIRVLRLGANNLTGKIPSSVGSLTRLQSLHLRRNNLSGTLPLSLQSCTNLVVLDLGRNYLTGRLPVWINKLSGLIILNLRLNRLQGDVPPELCHLKKLQTLDLAGNRFSGNIPKCFNNFSVMAGKQKPTNHIYYSVEDTFGGVADSQFLVLRGRFAEYSKNLQLVLTLDLSENLFSGSIPVEITSLVQIQALNLSRNYLTGDIPTGIGDMEFLESLDICRNRISGEIPGSISGLTFLSHLNVSYNNLTGRIPSGTQLRGFDEFSYIGNRLCGLPLSKNCNGNDHGDTHDDATDDNDHQDRDGSLLRGERFGIFVSLVVGFMFGFWGVIAPLLLNVSWRTTYFRLLSSLGNSICTIFGLNIS